MNTQNSGSTIFDEVGYLSPISITFEVEPELEYIVVELASETTLVTEFPFTIHNFKCQVFIWRPRMESQYSEIFVVTRRSLKIAGKKEIR